MPSPLDFLDLIFGDKSGHLCILIKAASGGGLGEAWGEWPKQRADFLETIEESMTEGRDVYFVPYLFTQPMFDPALLVPTDVVAVDLDDADVVLSGIQPTYLVRTSDNRRQGYWMLVQRYEEPSIDAQNPGRVWTGPAQLDADQVEVLRRNLAYSIAKADRTSWSLSWPFRLPGTVSHKYLAPFDVVLESTEVPRTYRTADLENVPDPPFMYTEEQLSFLNNPPQDPAQGPLAMLDTLKNMVPPQVSQKTASLYHVVRPPTQRASHIWEMILELAGMKAPRETIFWLVKLSDNSPYKALQYHEDREICKDILRAEAFAFAPRRNPRELVDEARTGAVIMGHSFEKKRQVYGVIYDNMVSEGEFLKVNDSTGYYIRKDKGRPIPVVRNNSAMASLISIQYGINPVELDHEYVVQELGSHVTAMHQNAIERSLSHYDKDLNTLYLHGGRKDVYVITPERIDKVTDGAHGVVFPWPTVADPFYADFNALDRLPKPWHEIMFGHAVVSVINMTREQAVALMTAWFFFVLLRNIAPSRPILAMFGQPGSGKTTFFKTLYALMYGKSRSIGAATTAEKFDHAMSSEALLVLDNVDTIEKWILDRLAQSSSLVDVPERKLYSNLETVIRHRHAMIGLTAHKAEFDRADIADRLIIIMLERLENKGVFEPENAIMDNVERHRSGIWAGVMRDLQKILATPMPRPEDTPQFRIKDFAHIGVWATRVLGMEQDFVSGLKTLGFSQRAFALEDENLLVDAAKRLLNHHLRHGEDATPWLRAKELFERLQSFSTDREAFVRRYHDATRFARHMGSVQRALEDTIKFERQFISGGASPGFQWRIQPPKDYAQPAPYTAIPNGKKPTIKMPTPQPEPQEVPTKP